MVRIGHLFDGLQEAAAPEQGDGFILRPFNIRRTQFCFRMSVLAAGGRAAKTAFVRDFQSLDNCLSIDLFIMLRERRLKVACRKYADFVHPIG